MEALLFSFFENPIITARFRTFVCTNRPAVLQYFRKFLHEFWLTVTIVFCTIHVFHRQNMWYIEMNGIEIWRKIRQIKEIPFGDT